MITNLILFTILSFVFSVVFIAVGGFTNARLLKLKVGNDKFQSFVDLVVGWLVVILFYSAVVTLGKTLSVLMIIPLGWMAFINKDKARVGEWFKWKDLLSHSVVVAGIFVISFLLSLFYDYGSSINNDLLFYSNIGKYISINGEENAFHYFYQYLSEENRSGLYPYHYFELYTQNLAGKILPFISSIFILKYFVYVFLKAVVFWGIGGFLIAWKRSLNIYLIIVVAMVASLIPFEQLLLKFNEAWPIRMSIWSRPNLLTYLLVLIPAFHFFRKDRYEFFLAFLFILTIVSSVTNPSVFAWTPLAFLGLWVFKRIDRSKFLKCALFYVVYVVAYYGFIKMFGLELKALDIPMEDIKEIYKTTWKAIVGQIVLLSVSIIIFPLVLSAISYKNSEDRKIVWTGMLLAVTLAIFGIIIFQLGHFIDNFYQMPYVGYSAVYLLLIIAISYLVTASENFGKYFAIVMLVGGFGYSLKFIDPVNTTSLAELNITRNRPEVKWNHKILSETNISGVGFMILDEKSINKLPPKKRELLTHQEANYLSYYFPDIQVLPFTEREIWYHKKGAGEGEFKKALDFNNQLPEDWFDGVLTLQSAVEKYAVSFLVVYGNENLEKVKMNFPSANDYEIAENKFIVKF